MKDLKDRVAWAIVIFQAKTNLTDPQTGKILSSNKNTVAAYRKKEGLIKGVVLEKLISNPHFSFNALWLMKNHGEPFPGAREEYPEVCGPEPEPPGTEKQIDKAKPLYNKVETPGVGDRMVEYNADVDLKNKLIRSQEKLIIHLEKENSDLKARLETIEKKAV